MRSNECGDWVLDTDGAHWVPAVYCAAGVPASDPDWQGAYFVEAPAVADAGHGAPRGPRGPGITPSIPDGYVALSDVPWLVRRTRKASG